MLSNKQRPSKSSLSINQSYIGETIEQKVERIVNNKEPISDGAPIIFTERKDGVLPEYDIRTDRFEVAIEAMDKVSKAQKAKREGKLSPVKGGKSDENDGKDDGGTEPIQATDNK